MTHPVMRIVAVSAGILSGLAVLAFAGASSFAAPIEVSEVVDDFNPMVDERVVEEGDTLWDISEEVLGRPELWPRVWALNPEITNPHWIFPGDVIRFYPSWEPEPSVHAGGAYAGSLDSGPFSVGENKVVKAGSDELDSEEMSPHGVPSWKSKGLFGRRGAYSGIFVSPTEMEEVGQIVTAGPANRMLIEGDAVFVEVPKETRPGDRFLVFRTRAEVDHPESGDFWGYLTEITGMVTIDTVKKKIARGKVSRTYSEVERGQFLTPFVQEPFVSVQVIDGPKEAITGHILVMTNTLRKLAGESYLVLVDRGRKDGLKAGHKLSVFGKMASGPYDDNEFDDEEEALLFQTNIGELLVLGTTENAATCFVTKAIREIEPGNVVRTILPGAAPSAKLPGKTPAAGR